MNDARGIKILDEIIGNKDKYSWVEINCFYKPWSIVHASYYPEYFDFYLLINSLFQTSIIENVMAAVDFNQTQYMPKYFDFYNKILGKLLFLETEVVCGLTDDALHQYIMDEINKNNRVIVPIDLFDLYYFENYRKRHHGNYIIIKGYDFERRLYYILDSKHNQGGVKPLYTDFVMPFDVVSKLNADYNSKNTYKEYQVQAWSLRKREGFKKITSNEVLNFFRVIMSKIEKQEYSFACVEEFLVNHISDSSNIFFIQDAYMKLNMRIVFFDMLISLLDKSGITDRREQISEIKDKIITQSNNILNSIVYHYKKKTFNKDLFTNHINELKRLEKKFREIIIETIPISIDEKKSDENNCDVFIEKNTNNALIKKNQNLISIVHSDNEIYNTWIFQDDAVQLLINGDGVQNFSIETYITFTAMVGKEFHVGYMCKLNNGSKMMFGNISGNSITLLSPEMQDFPLYEVQIENKFVHLRLEKKDKTLTFYFKNEIDDEWNIFYTYELPVGVKFFGLFSKTWIAMSNTVNFSELKYSIDTDIN